MFLYSCKQDITDKDIYNINKSNQSDSAMVATAHPLATEIGLQVIKDGGNAIDAGIAVQFALAVCYPGAGNIGGGGFFVYRTKTGEIAALDYREKAPLKATADMYLDSLGNPMIDKSLYGHLAAGVPGTVAGMMEAFEKFSKLKNWKRLIQPAIDLANNGVLLTKREAEKLNENQVNFKNYNLSTTPFQKQHWSIGDTLIQKELAETLTIIRDVGRAGFYEGKIAHMIEKEMKAGGGMITKDDLKNYQAVWRKPIVSMYRGHEIITMPPPSSGGIALVQMFKMVEPYPLGSLGFQSPAAVHLMVEAERRVYADRAKHLGDPDFYKVLTSTLIDSQYIANRMLDFNIRKASPSDSIQFGLIESNETTHFSIVDADGNALSATTTLNGSFGSFTVVAGAGFLLNNEMDDFSVKPGQPNMYGLIGAEANKIEPNKRMLSSMTPTIIVKNGKVKMVVGTPGGSTIITSVFQIIVNVLDFGMSIDQAVQSPRFHHQWLPDFISTEKTAIKPNDRKILESIGHHFTDRTQIGRVEAIYIKENGKIYGAADDRGDDDVKGY